MRNLLALLFLGSALFAPDARADLLFVGSLDGTKCCFDVQLTQIDAYNVGVTATLTEGATYFVDTGNDKTDNHPGFAFNITGAPAISIFDLVAPWGNEKEYQSQPFTPDGPVTSGGPALGVFDYYIVNPGHGANAANPGPLTFKVKLQDGGMLGIDAFKELSVSESGLTGITAYFAADILDASGATGMSAITDGPLHDDPPNPPPPDSTVPEPASILLLGTVAFGLFTSLKRQAR